MMKWQSLWREAGVQLNISFNGSGWGHWFNKRDEWCTERTKPSKYLTLNNESEQHSVTISFSKGERIVGFVKVMLHASPSLSRTNTLQCEMCWSVPTLKTAFSAMCHLRYVFEHNSPALVWSKIGDEPFNCEVYDVWEEDILNNRNTANTYWMNSK